MNQQVERSLVPLVLTPAALDPVKPQVLHPRLAELWLIRCQTSLNSLIYGATFAEDVDLWPHVRRHLAGESF